jgi:hypothetical protein
VPGAATGRLSGFPVKVVGAVELDDELLEDDDDEDDDDEDDELSDVADVVDPDDPVLLSEVAVPGDELAESDELDGSDDPDELDERLDDVTVGDASTFSPTAARPSIVVAHPTSTTSPTPQAAAAA